MRTTRTVLERFGGVYEDLELLVREYAVQSPNSGSETVRSDYSEWALDTLDAYLESNPRLASAAALVVGKHGLTKHLDELETMFRSRMLTDSPCRQQAIVILAGIGRLSQVELERLFVQSGPDAVQHLQFLLATLSGDRKAIGTALSGIQPFQKYGPDRWLVRARMLFLAPLVAKVDKKRWDAVSAGWLAKLRSNPRRLRDTSAERWMMGGP